MSVRILIWLWRSFVSIPSVRKRATGTNEIEFVVNRRYKCRSKISEVLADRVKVMSVFFLSIKFKQTSIFIKDILGSAIKH